jgi:hypothetical protein
MGRFPTAFSQWWSRVESSEHVKDTSDETDVVKFTFKVSLVVRGCELTDAHFLASTGWHRSRGQDGGTQREEALPNRKSPLALIIAGSIVPQPLDHLQHHHQQPLCLLHLGSEHHSMLPW